jgi:hypothetical protein
MREEDGGGVVIRFGCGHETALRYLSRGRGFDCGGKALTARKDGL